MANGYQVQELLVFTDNLLKFAYFRQSLQDEPYVKTSLAVIGQNMQASSTPLLSVKNLSITFSQEGEPVAAVQHLSFLVRAGERLGSVGESGSGKSVSALAIMGLLPIGAVKADEIKLQVFNQSPEDLGPSANTNWQAVRGKQIGMIFQEPMAALNPVLKCGKQIEEGLRLHLGATKVKAREQAMDWLARVQLKEPERVYHSYPHQLSGGQQQRIMIAMALALQPALLIADEPTTALDVRVQAEILDLLNRLCEEMNSALLFISHDLAVVQKMTDRILVLRKGNLIESGSTREILQKPQEEYTQALLACRPQLYKPVARLATFQSPAVTLHKREPVRSAKDERVRVEQASVVFENRINWRQKTQVHALKQVDLSVFDGEILGLVGESGSGKTTMGRSIMQMQKLAGGSISYGGKDLNTWSKKAYAREIQMIFQNPYAALNPRMPVGEAIQEVMRVHQIGASEAERRDRVFELLRTLHLADEHYHRLPYAFSGGQRQRLCIARALAAAPRFLICDEATASLDVSIQAEILNLLADLREEQGLTMLFISHDLASVSFLCDRVAVMQAGEIVELGEVEEVVNHPQHTYTQSLIQAVPQL
ncbi:MAG: ABC transporter ATP-binding protein [Bacteroidota bacterium]